jgi:hypothetical protein
MPPVLLSFKSSFIHLSPTAHNVFIGYICWHYVSAICSSSLVNAHMNPTPTEHTPSVDFSLSRQDFVPLRVGIICKGPGILSAVVKIPMEIRKTVGVMGLAHSLYCN